LVGSCPDTIDIREGAHSGEGQYAESKTTAPAAKASMFGVLIWEAGLWILRRGAASWSAIIYMMLGFDRASRGGAAEDIVEKLARA